MVSINSSFDDPQMSEKHASAARIVNSISSVNGLHFNERAGPFKGAVFDGGYFITP